MALDLSKPLRDKQTHTKAWCIDTGTRLLLVEELTHGVQVRPRSHSYICGCYENVPERRTLDCWLTITDEPNPRVTVHATESAAAWHGERNPAGCMAILHIQQDYEVGEGLS